MLFLFSGVPILWTSESLLKPSITFLLLPQKSFHPGKCLMKNSFLLKRGNVFTESRETFAEQKVNSLMISDSVCSSLTWRAKLHPAGTYRTPNQTASPLRCWKLACDRNATFAIKQRSSAWAVIGRDGRLSCDITEESGCVCLGVNEGVDVFSGWETRWSQFATCVQDQNSCRESDHHNATQAEPDIISPPRDAARRQTDAGDKAEKPE